MRLVTHERNEPCRPARKDFLKKLPTFRCQSVAEECIMPPSKNSQNKGRACFVHITVGFNARMSGSYRKLFRESHRELRLKQWQPGHDTTFEVRPLSLTPAPVKLMRIKDTSDKHERK